MEVSNKYAINFVVRLNQMLIMNTNFTISVPYAKTARILIIMSMPGMVVFIFVADLIHMSESTIGPVFVFTFLFVSLLQVS